MKELVYSLFWKPEYNTTKSTIPQKETKIKIKNVLFQNTYWFELYIWDISSMAQWSRFKAAAIDDSLKGLNPVLLLSASSQWIHIRTTRAEHGEHRRSCLEQQNAWYLAKRSYWSRLSNNIRKKSRQAKHSSDLGGGHGGVLQGRLGISYGSRFKGLSHSLPEASAEQYNIWVLPWTKCDWHTNTTQHQTKTKKWTDLEE